MTPKLIKWNYTNKQIIRLIRLGIACARHLSLTWRCPIISISSITDLRNFCFEHSFDDQKRTMFSCMSYDLSKILLECIKVKPKLFQRSDVTFRIIILNNVERILNVNMIAFDHLNKFPSDISMCLIEVRVRRFLSILFETMFSVSDSFLYSWPSCNSNASP